jgi:hypothetical protein
MHVSHTTVLDGVVIPKPAALGKDQAENGRLVVARSKQWEFS